MEQQGVDQEQERVVRTVQECMHRAERVVAMAAREAIVDLRLVPVLHQHWGAEFMAQQVQREHSWAQVGVELETTPMDLA